jgi:hypothetical protein
MGILFVDQDFVEREDHYIELAGTEGVLKVEKLHNRSQS